ncbi:50S ribosomal protein L9, partial [Buchnera aphidicola]|nr:50S ribosomal protein L9 [Buchnera aphidicola]
MEIILLSKLNKLGDIGSIINVKSGYARNFLIPTGKAIVANKKNLDSFHAQRLQLQEERNNQLMLSKLR